MFVKKSALQWVIVLIFLFIFMGSIWTPSAQAQYWTALPPYNFLWPLWSPVLSPVDPLTGMPTPLVSNLSSNTVLPVHPVVVLDPSQEYAISIYNKPSGFKGGKIYFHQLYGLNSWPPPNMIDPYTGMPIPVPLTPGYELISPLDPETHGSVITQGNLAYLNQYPGVPLSDLLTVEDIWGLHEVCLSLHIEDALEGVSVNKVVGDTAGPTNYTRLEIVAKIISFGSSAKDNIPVVLTIPGDLFGSPINTWVRDSNGGALTSVPYVNLGGGKYRVTTDLSPLIIFPGIIISYRKQIVWRFLIPKDTSPQNVTVTANVGTPYTAPIRTGTIRILAPGSVRSLIIVNRRLLFDNYNSWHVTRLLQRLFTEAQGWPANHTPRAVIYYVERYDSRALNWDNTSVDYTNETTANVAANAIDDLIEDWHEDATNYIEIFIPIFGPIRIPIAWPNYLLIVGNDDTIPSYRYNDPSNDEGIDRISWACLHGWCVNSATNPAVHATDEDYFFTDNPYADLYGGTDWQTGDIELWAGRLLGESAEDMLSLLEEGVDWNNGRRGVVVMASVDGWELGLEPDDGRAGEVADLYDVTSLFRNKGFAVRNDNVPAAEVQTIDVMGPYEGGNTSWNNNFRNAANNTEGMDLFFIGGHDNYDEAVIPGDDFSPDGTPTTYFRFDDDHPIAMIVGCHGGIPVQDIDVPGGADHSLVYDLIHEGAKAYIGATGFSYGSPGDLHRCLFGERLMQHFFYHFLRPMGSNSMVIGKALAEAKQDYVFGFGTNDALDRKTVTEFNLYGVPWTFIFYPGAMMSSMEAVDMAMEQPGDSAFNTIARSIESSAEEKIYTRTFEINIDSYEVQTEVQDNITYHSFSIKGGDVAVSTKSPILPYIKAFTMPYPPGEYDPIPPDTKVIEVEIVKADSTAIGKYNIPISEVKPFSEGGLIYTTETDIDYLYPSDDHLVQYQKNSSNELLFTIFPIQHNPSTNETVFYKHFEVMVTYESPLNVTLTEFTTNKAQYLPGERIDTISRIANVGDVDAVLTATLSVIDMLGETLGTFTSDKFTVPSGQSYNLPLSWTGMLGDGDYKLQVTLFSDNSPVGGASADVSVISGKITDMKVPKTIPPDTEGMFEITIANYRSVNVEGQVFLTIQESEGGFVVDLPPKTISIPDGSFRTVTFTWLPEDLWEGFYSVVATVIVDNQQYGPVSKSFYVGTHENNPPDANAGPDNTLFANKDCLAQIQLDGAGSYDPDGDPLTYEWTWTGGSANGINPVVTLHLGVSTITLTVSDGLAIDTDSVVIKVVDNTQPEITCPTDITTEQTSEDGTPVDLGAPIITDNCDTSPTITNNAPALFPPGETIVTWTATDASGNSSSCTQTVNILKPAGPCMFTAEITATGQLITGLENNISTVTIGINPDAETKEAPPLPQKYTVIIEISEGLSIDIRPPGAEREEWELNVEVGGEADPDKSGFFPVLSWDPNVLPPPDPNCGYLKLYSEDAQRRCSLLVNDMYQTTQYQTKEEDGYCFPTSNKCIFNYYIVWAKEMTFEMHLSAGWSMVSFPIFPPALPVLDLFPGVVVVYGFKKGVGYVRSKEILEAGKGYWFLLNKAQTYNLTGQPIQEHTSLVYEEGWEMIGGCAYPAKATTDGCNIDVIYRYVPGVGYQRVLESENIEPGKGYWMLLSNIKDRCEYRIETADP